MTLDNGATWTVLQMSKVGFIDPAVLDHSGNYTLLNMNYEAISNATDAGTGNSPLKAVLYNGKATAY